MLIRSAAASLDCPCWQNPWFLGIFYSRCGSLISYILPPGRRDNSEIIGLYCQDNGGDIVSALMNCFLTNILVG